MSMMLIRAPQCIKEIQHLHLPLRKLNIGTYVSTLASSDTSNPYHPIATATLTTPVFDVVHMFSERSISAVPIIDEEGVVVNLYETVDVIVRPSFSRINELLNLCDTDPRPTRGLPVARSHNIRGT